MPADEFHAFPQSLRRFFKRENADSLRPDSIKERGENFFRRDFVQSGARIRHQRTDPHAPFRFNRFAVRIPMHTKIFGNEFGKKLLDVGERNRRGGKNDLSVSFAFHRRQGEELIGTERIGFAQFCSSAVRERIVARTRRAGARNPVRICERNCDAGGFRINRFLPDSGGGCGLAEGIAQTVQNPRIAGIFPLQCAQAKAEVYSIRIAERVALSEESGKSACRAAESRAFRTENGVSEAGMNGKGEHCGALFRNRAGLVERSEFAQKFRCLCDFCRRRNIEPRHGADCIRAHAPFCQLKNERDKVCFENFGSVEWRHARLFLRAPKTVAYSGGGSSGASAALIRGRKRDTDRFQASHSVARREFRYAHESAVNHNPYALNREARFGDGGGEDDFAVFRIGFNCGVLFLLRQIAVKRSNPDLRRERFLQQGCGPADFSLAGQKSKKIAFRILFQREADSSRQVVFDWRPRIAARNVDGLDRMDFAWTVDDGCAAEQNGDAFRIECGGHDQNVQIFAQRLLEVKAESQCQVRMDAPFVEFIENDGVNTRQFRIVLNQPRENAFGQHLYSGFRRDFGIEARAVADKPSERGVHQRGDAFRRCARGETARFKHENFSRIRSGFFIKKRRNEGCFSRSGRGAENRRSVRMQGFRELRKDRFYGKLDQRLTIFSGLTILSNSSAERKPSSTHASLRVCPL